MLPYYSNWYNQLTTKLRCSKVSITVSKYVWLGAVGRDREGGMDGRVKEGREEEERESERVGERDRHVNR